MLKIAIILGLISVIGLYATTGTRKRVSAALVILSVLIGTFDIALTRSDYSDINSSGSNAVSQDASPQVVLHAELKKTCQANSGSAPCIFIGSTAISACKAAASSEYSPNAGPIPVCAEEVQNLLSAKGVSSQVFTQQIYDEGFNPAAPYNAGCIGWRSDMGATREGALDIPQILGKGYTVGTGCNSSGYSYQVMLRS